MIDELCEQSVPVCLFVDRAPQLKLSVCMFVCLAIVNDQLFDKIHWLNNLVTVL